MSENPYGNLEAEERREAIDDDLATLRRLLQHVDEGLAYVSYYLSVRADQAKSKAKIVLILAGLGVVGFIAAASLLWTSARLLVVGLADGLSRLLGNQPWAGNLLTGALLLTLIGGGGYLMLKRTKSGLNRQTREKYYRLRQHQRKQFGRSVQEAALRGGNHQMKGFREEGTA